MTETLCELPNFADEWVCKQTGKKKNHTGETKSDNMLSPFILTMVAQI